MWQGDFTQWLTWLENAVRTSSQPSLVVYQNLHNLYLLHRHPTMTTCYQQAALCYLDGYGVWLLCRLLGRRVPKQARFSFMDCFPDVLGHAERMGWRVFYLGANPDSHARGMEVISSQFPDLVCTGEHGYQSDTEVLVARINDYAPDLLFVGMGSPQQEQWINDHFASLRARVVLTAGGTLDYYSGTQAKPPEALSRIGLAWLYRLVANPRRLAFRYLVEPLLLVPVVLRHAVALRRTSKQRKDC